MVFICQVLGSEVIRLGGYWSRTRAPGGCLKEVVQLWFSDWFHLKSVLAGESSSLGLGQSWGR